MSHIKPILNPPIDYSRIGQDQAEAAQTEETTPVPEGQVFDIPTDGPIGIESGVLEVKADEGESSEPAEDDDAKPTRVRGRR